MTLLRESFTRDDLAKQGISGGDADEVLAFREFLKVAGPIPEKGSGRTVDVPEPWYSYALGRITGAEALKQLQGGGAT